MDEYNDAEEKVEDVKEGGVEETPLADVHQLVTDAETAITDGTKTKNEAIDELVSSLQGMKEEKSPMGGMGSDETFPLPEEE